MSESEYAEKLDSISRSVRSERKCAGCGCRIPSPEARKLMIEMGVIKVQSTTPDEFKGASGEKKS